MPRSTSVCGSIATDTTWTPTGSVYVVTCHVTVNAGVTLTVQPGAVVKFQNVTYDPIVDGRLLAQGTVAEPVVFTSYRDDAHGGDTNGDGEATSPASANWGGIVFTASSSGSASRGTQGCWPMHTPLQLQEFGRPRCATTARWTRVDGACCARRCSSCT